MKKRANSSFAGLNSLLTMRSSCSAGTIFYSVLTLGVRTPTESAKSQLAWQAETDHWEASFTGPAKGSSCIWPRVRRWTILCLLVNISFRRTCMISVQLPVKHLLTHGPLVTTYSHTLAVTQILSDRAASTICGVAKEAHDATVRLYRH